MKRDLLPRFAGFTAALAVIFAAACLWYGARAARLEAYVGLQNERALSALSAALDGLDLALRKTALLPAGELRSMSAAEVWRQAERAQAALSVLPLAETQLPAYARWLAQTGGCAFTLLRQGVYGAESSAADALRGDAQLCAQLRARLEALKERTDGGALRFSALPRGQGTAATVASAFAESEASLSSWTGLDYEGPYADADQTARGLAGLPDCTAAEARRAAEALLGAGGLTPLGESGGALPCYRFGDGAGLTAAVTRQGARLLSLRDERETGAAALTAEQARQIGARWLAAHGFSGLVAGDAAATAGATATFSFYAADGGAVFYPDRVVLGVSLSDGAVVRLDAGDYWRCHVARTRPQTDRSAPPQGLTVLSDRLAVIADAGGREVWCREYLCQTEAGRALCYVGCESGRAEQLLLIGTDDRGTYVR